MPFIWYLQLLFCYSNSVHNCQVSPNKILLHVGLLKTDKFPIYFFLNFIHLLFDFSLNLNTVELQWLEHLSDHENMFETGVVRANEC